MDTLSIFASELDQKLRSLKHVALIAHKSPDGDAYWSLEGMRQLLLTNFPELTVSVVVPREKTADTHVSWIIAGEISETIPADAELVLLLDAALLSRTALTEAQYPTQEIISIDHHELQPGNIAGYRDTGVPSTTVILTQIAQTLNWQITPLAATALLLGVYTDTGGFIHRNSNQAAFETAWFLMSKWADQLRITQEAFGNYSLEYLHDLGKCLLSIVRVWNIACLFFEETESNSHLKSHIIGYLSGLRDVDVACVLMQKWTEVKGSFRTRKEGIDVNELAKKLGGGWHKKASGFTLEWAISGDNFTWNGTTYTQGNFIEYIKNLL